MSKVYWQDHSHEFFICECGNSGGGDGDGFQPYDPIRKVGVEPEIGVWDGDTWQDLDCRVVFKGSKCEVEPTEMHDNRQIKNFKRNMLRYKI